MFERTHDYRNSSSKVRFRGNFSASKRDFSAGNTGNFPAFELQRGSVRKEKDICFCFIDILRSLRWLLKTKNDMISIIVWVTTRFECLIKLEQAHFCSVKENGAVSQMRIIQANNQETLRRFTKRILVGTWSKRLLPLNPNIKTNSSEFRERSVRGWSALKLNTSWSKLAGSILCGWSSKAKKRLSIPEALKQKGNAFCSIDFGDQSSSQIELSRYPEGIKNQEATHKIQVSAQDLSQSFCLKRHYIDSFSYITLNLDGSKIPLHQDSWLNLGCHLLCISRCVFRSNVKRTAKKTFLRHQRRKKTVWIRKCSLGFLNIEWSDLSPSAASFRKNLW